MNANDNIKQNLHCISTDDTLQDIDISNILEPDKADFSASLLTEQDFILQHPYSRPLLNNQLEFFSSREERLQIASPRLANLAHKKAMQKRMRIIILVDIVLFIVIFGVIYPSLRKLQTSGKISSYRFSLSQSFDRDAALLNIVTKIEQLAQGSQNTEFVIRINYQGKLLLQEERPLPQINSPVSYALFLIPYQQLQPNPNSSQQSPKASNNLDIIIQLGQVQKQFFLPLPKFSQPE